MPRIARRPFLELLGGFAFAGAGAPAFADTSEAISLRVGAGLDVESTPVLFAAHSGLFERYGLKVEVVKIPGGGTAIAAAVAGGGIDIGKASTFALVAAHAKGVPFVLLAPGAYYSSDKPDIPLVVAANSPYHTAKDMNGKTIAVVSLSTTMRIATQAWMDQNGADSSSVHFVELSPPAVPAALEQGRIDASPLSEPILSPAVNSGKVRPIGYVYNALGKHFELADWFTTSDFVAKHRDAAVRFARAMQEANAYVGSHEAELTPLIASYVGIDVAVLSKMRNPERGTIYEPSLIEPLIEVALKYKAIPKAFPAVELISDAAIKPSR
jgi:NitT/TauT family transport system substrate-binding protein